MFRAMFPTQRIELVSFNLKLKFRSDYSYIYSFYAINYVFKGKIVIYNKKQIKKRDSL